jgi:hypothetical protein
MLKLKPILKWTTLTILCVLVVWIFIAYWTSTNDCERLAATPTNPMKAITSCEYGVDNLKLQEIEKPTPADNELLVRQYPNALVGRRVAQTKEHAIRHRFCRQR